MPADLGAPPSALFDRIWQAILWMGGAGLTISVAVIGHMHARITTTNDRVDQLAAELSGAKEAIEKKRGDEQEKLWVELRRMNKDSVDWRERLGEKMNRLITRDEMRDILGGHDRTRAGE